MNLLIAFSTDDGENLIDQHAGMAKYFDIYRFTDDNVEFVDRRPNSSYGGDETMKHGDPKKAASSVEALGDDVQAWVNKKFGPNVIRLSKRVVCVITRTDRIKDAIALVRENIDRVAEEYAKGEQRKHLLLKPQQ